MTEPADTFAQKYKYQILGAAYITVTGAIFYRIAKRSYTPSIRWEQYESVFKGTTLATLVAGAALSGGINKPRHPRSELE